METVLPRLAVDLGATERTVRRAFTEGLIRGRRPSPRRLDIPLAEREYLRRNWPALARLRAGLRTEPGVRAAFLFGSRSRGDHRAESDFDLVVALGPGADPYALRDRLGRKLGAVVQLVMLEDARRAPLLMNELVRDGRVIVDREHVWPGIQRRRRAIERAAARERTRIDDEFQKMFDPA